LLEVLEVLVPRPWRVVGPTEAVLFRKIDKSTPTLLLDEIDNVFHGAKSKMPEAAGMRQVLNAGYRAGAVVPRCAGKNADKLIDFKVFCPKALGGIGSLPDTVNDRCIPIVLARRKPGEVVARFRFRDIQAEAQPIREALVVWAIEAMDLLRVAEPF